MNNERKNKFANLCKILSIFTLLAVFTIGELSAQATQLIDARKQKKTLLANENGDKAETMDIPKPEFKAKLAFVDALMNRKSTREFAKDAITPQQLSNLLWAANGVNRDKDGRTAPSAMGSNMIDIYAVTPEGIYLWHPLEFKLSLVAKGDFRETTTTTDQEFAMKAPLTFIYVAKFENYYKKVESDKTPINQLSVWAGIEAGHISQNVYLACVNLGLGAVIRVSYNEEKLFETLKLRENTKIIAVQTIGVPKKK